MNFDWVVSRVRANVSSGGHFQVSLLPVDFAAVVQLLWCGVQMITVGRRFTASWMIVRRRAFTLLELLVAVAIIALLIALLMPQLDKARQHAKRTVCLAHLKQIGSAFYSYGGNNGGMVPDGGVLSFHYDPKIKGVIVDTPNGTNNWQVTWPE